MVEAGVENEAVVFVACAEVEVFVVGKFLMNEAVEKVGERPAVASGGGGGYVLTVGNGVGVIDADCRFGNVGSTAEEESDLMRKAVVE